MSKFIQNAIDDYINPWGDYSHNNFITIIYIIHGVIVFSFIALTNYQIVPDDLKLLLLEAVLFGVVIVAGFIHKDYGNVLYSFFWLILLIFFIFLALYNLEVNFYIPKPMYIYLEAFSIFISLFHFFYSYRILNNLKHDYPGITPYFISLIGIMLVLFSKNLYFFSYEGEVDFKLWLSWTLFTYMLLLSFYLTLESIDENRIENDRYNRITIINFFIWLSALIPAVIYINSSFFELGSYIPQLVLENQQLITTYINIILGFLLVYFLVDSVESLIRRYLDFYIYYESKLFFIVMILVTGYISMNIFYGSEYLSDSNTLQLSVYLVFGILFTILLRFFFDMRVLGIYFVLSMILFNNLDVNFATLEMEAYVWNSIHDPYNGHNIFIWIFHAFATIIQVIIYLVIFGWLIDIILNLGVIFLKVVFNAVVIELFYGALIFIFVYLIRFTIFSNKSYVALIQRSIATIVIALLAVQLSTGNYSHFLTQVTSIDIKQEQAVNNIIIPSNNTISNIPQCTYFNVVRARQLNIRDKPGKPSNVVGRLNKGEGVCIYDFTGKWGRTDRGWVSGKYLSKNSSNNTISNIPQCTYFNVVRARQLNIRDKPGKPSNVVGRLNKGESVCIYDFTGKWGRTDLGWVSGKYLSKN